MDHLTTIFLRRLPTTNINILEKVFTKEITFTKQANPNGGGLMLPAQAVMVMSKYPIKVHTMPSQFIPMDLVLL